LAPDHLFVYGTLRRGSDNKFARLLAARAEFSGPARVPGRLYDFGRYPGARYADQPDQWVIGEVFHLDEPAKLLAALDDYEGLEYERALVSATLDDGRSIECCIYWYVGSVPGEIIASGDWLQR
jgi:gamma-glutamylcyclotransferase (GGCT)/AIG2-like uncharacterized protein YtfP